MKTKTLRIVAFALTLALLLAVSACALAESVTATPCEPEKHEWSLSATNVVADYQPADYKTHRASRKTVSTYVCAICGAEKTEESTPVETTEDHVYDSSTGTCTVCGYTCEHTMSGHLTFSNGACWICGVPCTHDWSEIGEYGYEPGEVLEVLERNEKTHTIRCAYRAYIMCSICGAATFVPAPDAGEDTFSAPHYFMNGVCEDCGYESGCTHPTTEKWYVYSGEPIASKSLSDTEHEITTDYCWVYTRCSVCEENLSWSNPEAYPVVEILGEEYTFTEPHRYDADGVCENCGHACSHANAKYDDTYYLMVGDAVKIDEYRHKETDVIYDLYFCPDCSSYLHLNESAPAEYVFYHNYIDGVCDGCGAVNTCTHPHTSVFGDEYEDVTVVSFDKDQHTVSCGKYVGYRQCDVCLETIETITKSEYTLTERHLFEDGVCTVCGYTCPHESFTTGSNHMLKGVISHDATGHTIKADTYTYRACDDCDYFDEETTGTDVTLTENHEFYNGFCTICGERNTCTHPTTKTTYGYTEDVTVLNKTDTTHTLHAAVAYPYVVCTVCDETISREAPKTDFTWTEEHYFDRQTGICYDCDYKKPASSGGSSASETQPSKPKTVVVTTEDAPAPVLEPAAQAVTAAQAMNNLTSIIEQTQQSSSVVIAGAQELMTDGEYEKLSALPTNEQVYVVLSSIGLRDIVESALASSGAALSANGQALMAEVSARLTTATGEEKAAIEETLKAYFPTEQIVLNGVSVKVYVVELIVETNGAQTVRRFGFYQTATGAWTLEELPNA